MGVVAFVEDGGLFGAAASDCVIGGNGDGRGMVSVAWQNCYLGLREERPTRSDVGRRNFAPNPELSHTAARRSKCQVDRPRYSVARRGSDKHRADPRRLAATKPHGFCCRVLNHVSFRLGQRAKKRANANAVSRSGNDRLPGDCGIRRERNSGNLSFELQTEKARGR